MPRSSFRLGVRVAKELIWTTVMVAVVMLATGLFLMFR